jgi:hypothetical protein
MWFIDREAALTDQLDPFRIAVDTENVVADGGETAASDQTDVAAANDTHSHEFTLR